MGTLLNKTSERNSNIELLRLICMFFVVASHIPAFAVDGIFTTGLTLNKSILSLFRLSGTLGVDIFVIISGYFLINSKFSFTRILKLVLETWFYSVILYVIMCVTGNSSFALSDLVLYLLPITYNRYWFITAYVIMSFLAPFLNVALKAIGKKGHLWLLIVMFFFFSVVPTVLRLIYAFSVRKITLPISIYSAPCFFLVLYSVGAYIRLYGVKFSRIKELIAAISGVAVQLILVAILYIMSSSNNISYWDIDLFWEAFSSFQVISATGIFLLVINAKPRTNKVINFISGGALGVYLIHETPCVRTFLWSRAFSFGVADEPYMLLGKILLTTAIIFIGCIAIDLARKFLVERPVFSLIGDKAERIWNKLKNKIAPKKTDEKSGGEK